MDYDVLVMRPLLPKITAKKGNHIMNHWRAFLRTHSRDYKKSSYTDAFEKTWVHVLQVSNLSGSNMFNL